MHSPPFLSFPKLATSARLGRCAVVCAALAIVNVLLSCESPQAPALCGSIPEQTLTVGESATVSACFDAGEALSYETWTSDPGIAAISGSGASVTVTAVSPGSALVTIVASNAHGLKSQLSFRVMVPNRPPLVLGEIANHEVSVGDSVAMDVSGYFNEPDGQALTYAAEANPVVSKAAVTGVVLTVVAVAKGADPIKVTATDPGGLAATQSFLVTVPNQPPLPEDTVAAQTVEVGDTAEVDVTPLFTDPDGDALTYSVSTSEPAVAVAFIADRTLSVMAAAKGQAVVIVTATDTDGLTAEQSFSVTVPNRPPHMVEAIPARTVEVGDAAALDLAPFFTDPDGDALLYTAVVDDEGVATVVVAGSSLTVTAVSKGETAVAVTTTDDEGLTVTQDFAVTVPNQPPLPVGSIPAHTMRVDSVTPFEAVHYFEDPDGDALFYTATSSDTTVVRVEVSGATLSVSAVARGGATITVKATDTEGLVTTQTFAVTVPNRPPLVEGEIEAQSLRLHVPEVLDLTLYFSEPDSDALTYSAVASDTAVALVGVVDGTLSVTVKAKGEAIVTVTATDTEGLTAKQSFAVTALNRPPHAVDAIPRHTVAVGDATTLDLTRFFEDPDGDALAFTAAITDEGVAAAVVAGGAVTVAAVAKGETTVTVTATDDEGLKVTQDFVVTVPNQAPQPVGSIPAHAMRVDSVTILAAVSYFEDPDGDSLVYTAASSDTTVVRAGVNGVTIVVSAVSKGEAIINVTATDTEGLVTTQSFSISVPNQPPLVEDRIEAQSLPQDESVVLDLTQFFADPDGDPLSFEAVSTSHRVVAVSVADGKLTLSGKRRGRVRVTATATDAEGLTVEQVFVVTVTRGAGNDAPRVTSAISSRSLSQGGRFTADLSDHFTDSDGDPLVFQATSSSPAVATATVSGSTLDVNAVGRGTTSITVTASDPHGGSATLRFTVAVDQSVQPNRAPEIIARLPARNIVPGETSPADLNDHFEDPDNDQLVFDAASADEAIVVASVTGSELMVKGVGNGSTTVTVTAKDSEDKTASQSFGVTVEKRGEGNQRPSVTDVIAFQTLKHDGSFTIDLGGHFSDPDNDDLNFGAGSSNSAVATASVSGSELTVTAVGRGTATITVTAQDPGGLSASLDFDVTVRAQGRPNRAPVVSSSPPDLFYIVRSALYFQGWRYFSDPDDDELTYSMTLSDPSLAGVDDDDGDGYFEVTGRHSGSTTITVSATDPDGLSAQASFTFTVGNRTPQIRRRAGDLTSSRGQVDSLTLGEYFEDDDGGDVLELSVESSDPARVAVSVEASGLYGWYAEIRGRAVGTATVTLTATDVGGLSVSQSFTVTVDSNRPPRVAATFSDLLQFTVGDTVTFVLSEYFTDPDGDDLTYTAQAGYYVSATVSGDTLYMTSPRAGIFPAIVTAEDPGGRTVDQRFIVTVYPASSSWNGTGSFALRKSSWKSDRSPPVP